MTRDWRGKEGKRATGGRFLSTSSICSERQWGRTRGLRGREQLEIPLREGGSSRSSFLPSLSLSLSHPLSPIQGVSALPPSLSRSLVLTGISLAAALTQLSSALSQSHSLVRSLARTSVLFPPKTRLQLCCMRQFSAPLPPSFLLTQLLSAVTEKGKVSCDM